MKRLMFATSLAATVAALGLGSIEAMAADPLNAVGFESYQVGVLGSNGTAESNEFGTGPFFYFEGDSNSSAVSNDTDTASSKRTAYFTASGAQNAKYLALDTEGGTLWRSIAQISNTEVEGVVTYGLGAAQAVAATGTYLDTLVQFTVTEDEAPTVGEGDKLAIWLQADGNTTNLMVKANYWASAGEDPVATIFTIDDDVSIQPGTWYRLTVKAIPSITTAGAPFPAFQIFIDGTSIAATTAPYGEDFQDVASARYADGVASLIAANKLFPTLAERPSSLEDVTLQGVGFQGTGAVDEIVWTNDDPFPASTIDFTLTWGEGVSAVSYVLSTDLTATNILTSGTAVHLAPGDGTATIELIPTFESGYEFDKVTMGETELGLTFAIPGVTTNATLLAKAAAPAYPDYLENADATIKGKYDTWKGTYQADTQSGCRGHGAPQDRFDHRSFGWLGARDRERCDDADGHGWHGSGWQRLPRHQGGRHARGSRDRDAELHQRDGDER